MTTNDKKKARKHRHHGSLQIYSTNHSLTNRWKVRKEYYHYGPDIYDIS